MPRQVHSHVQLCLREAVLGQSSSEIRESDIRPKIFWLVTAYSLVTLLVTALSMAGMNIAPR